MEYKDALRRAAAMCSRQEQCSTHIREKLLEWNTDPSDVDKIIVKLQEEKFLDDQRYANFYVRDKFRFNKWGKIKITAMLRQKGIYATAIEEALKRIDDKAYYDTCAELIQKKSESLDEENHFTRKGKLFRFAAGRGFESELIHRILS